MNIIPVTMNNYSYKTLPVKQNIVQQRTIQQEPSFSSRVPKAVTKKTATVTSALIAASTALRIAKKQESNLDNPPQEIIEYAEKLKTNKNIYGRTALFDANIEETQKIIAPLKKYPSLLKTVLAEQDNFKFTVLHDYDRFNISHSNSDEKIELLIEPLTNNIEEYKKILEIKDFEKKTPLQQKQARILIKPLMHNLDSLADMLKLIDDNGKLPFERMHTDVIKMYGDIFKNDPELWHDIISAKNMGWHTVLQGADSEKKEALLEPLRAYPQLMSPFQQYY